MSGVRPVFVLGSPRSGTTLLGSYVASHPDCADLGEFFGFYSTLSSIPRMMERIDSPVKYEYLSALVQCTLRFANDVAESSGKRFWCDQTPFNLLAIRDILSLVPGALFILTLRHYSGAVQSLQRSFNDGYRWAGATIEESAAVWARFYAHARALDDSSTIVVSFDRLCANPRFEIGRLRDALCERLSVHAEFNEDVLARSHATFAARQTAARVSADGFEFTPVQSVDHVAWTDECDARCMPHVLDVDRYLRTRFAEYADPRHMSCYKAGAR